MPALIAQVQPEKPPRGAFCVEDVNVTEVDYRGQYAVAGAAAGRANRRLGQGLASPASHWRTTSSRMHHLARQRGVT